jgi:hypothetical protein
MTATNDVPTPVHDAAERRARGYAWETFRAGNFVGLRHGAKSERVLAPLAAQLAAALVAERPDLAAPAYRYAVSAWARAETLAMLLFGALEGNPDGASAAKSILSEHRAAERRAAEERRNLGLDPSAAARLAREQAEATKSGFDARAAIDKGNEVIDVRAVERARAVLPPGVDRE